MGSEVDELTVLDGKGIWTASWAWAVTGSRPAQLPIGLTGVLQGAYLHWIMPGHHVADAGSRNGRRPIKIRVGSLWASASKPTWQICNVYWTICAPGMSQRGKRSLIMWDNIS